MSDLLALVRAGAWSDALDALLAQFRARPAREVADAIRAVSARLLEQVPPTRGADKKRLVGERIPSAMPADLGRIILEIQELRPGLQLDLLAAVRKHGDDPRWSDAVIALLQRVHRRKAWLDAMWDRGLAMLEQAGGVRERLHAFPETPASARDPRSVEVAPAPLLLDREAETYRAIVDTAKRVGAAIAAHRETERSGFLAAIYADPGARGPKEVYADWLMSHGDPRGDFIMHQLAGKPWRDESSMIARYNSIWRYPFTGAHRTVWYRNGFPVRATHGLWPTDDDPAWSLIEMATNIPSDTLDLPLLTELQLVAEVADRLAARTKPLTATRVVWRSPCDRMVELLDRITIVPGLRELRVDEWSMDAVQLEQLFHSRFAAPATHLRVVIDPREFLLGTALAQASPRLQQITMRIQGAAVWQWGRAEDGSLTRARGAFHVNPTSEEIRALFTQLVALPRGAVTSFALSRSSSDMYAAWIREALAAQGLADIGETDSMTFD
ncbi:MAG: TIGR02996 domain-containing protein [Kofleriaceae bacterium]